MTKEKALQLVDDYGNAAMKAGTSNSGLCIDPCAGYQWKNMQELRTKLKTVILELHNHEEDSPLCYRHFNEKYTITDSTFVRLVRDDGVCIKCSEEGVHNA